MTAQVSEKFILKDEKYNTLIAIDSPIDFSPHLFGITPQVACTACWNSFWCDFNISREAFIIENLYVNSKDDFYPDINGVSPTLEPYDDLKQLKYMGHRFYKGINYSISYTGRIMVACGFIIKYMTFSGPQKLRAYREVSEWTYKNGEVIESRDISEIVHSFREELEVKEGENQFNPFLGIFVHKYSSLSNYSDEWWIDYL